MAILHYHVAPRYTAGSPAMVDQATAERVMAQERSCYAHALEGVYGIDEQHAASVRGLADIVWTTIERRATLIRHDLLTDAASQQRIRRDGTLAT